jgi:hypothetical protein
LDKNFSDSSFTLIILHLKKRWVEDIIMDLIMDHITVIGEAAGEDIMILIASNENSGRLTKRCLS